MKKIMYGSFVDYILTKDKSKKAFIRKMKTRGNYSVAKDFYMPLRNCIIQVCKKNKSIDELDNMHNKLSDQRKKNSYAFVIAKIKDFLLNENYSWVQPDRVQIEYGGLDITVNPELGLKLDNKIHFIKLYFKIDKINQAKVNLLIKIMQDSYNNHCNDITVAVLDVRNGIFYTNNAKDSIEIPYNLDSEALNWLKTWEDIEED